MELRTKRAYDFSTPDDGIRVLVDRLWPRGLGRAELRVDEWLKDIAPSKELRTWFGHDPANYEEFARRYRRELSDGDAHEALQYLRALATHHDITLVYGAKNTEHNNARVLAEILGGDHGVADEGDAAG